jgi:ubiquinone/menaquinone biosynthesis C-methylase UbiE
VSEWYQKWFGEAYLELYPHRNAAEASRAVALLARHGVVTPGRLVLDLACGAGRHAMALREAGVPVTGLDLSVVLLHEARQTGAHCLVRGDMRRLPYRGASLHGVVNLFTSFGYFADDAASETVLREVARVLVPGGRFALDFLNAPAVRATFVPRDERTVGSRQIVQERRLSEQGRAIVKTIHFVDEGREFMERVRLYERPELEQMLITAGMRVDLALGDYDGGPHTDTSPRLMLLATRS